MPSWRRGGNFLDTANKYTEGTSEKLLGAFIRSDRGRFVLATKYTSAMRAGDPNGGGNHRKAMVEALEGSLRRLGTDYVDLYWMHAWDAMTPVQEVMRAFDDLVRAGKVLYIGITDAPAWIVSQANTLAELRGWTPFVGLQVEYSLVERAPERDLLPMARALDIGVTAWSPLAGGLLTGKYNKDAPKGGASEAPRFEVASGFSRISERNLKIAEVVQRTAREIGASPAQVALNWTRRKNTLPILGGRKLSQIQDNLGCLEVSLSEEQVKNLDEASRIELGFPHDFLQNPTVRNIMFGGTDALTDNHRA